MAFDPTTICSGRSAKPPRIILAGVQKIGKSTFGGDSENPFIIPIVGETGVDEIDAPKSPPAKSVSELMEILTWLAESDAKHSTVVIDSLSTLEPLVWDVTSRRHGVTSIEQVLKGWGKGFDEALYDWRDIQAPLDYLRDAKGMGCILLAHVKVKSFNDPLADPYDQYQLALNAKAAEQLERWCDCLLFANFKNLARTVKEQGDKKIVHATTTAERYLYTQKRAGHPGGCRRNLPYEIPFSYAEFKKAYDAASAGVPKK